MKVIAKQGTRCPKEGKPRQYITDSEPVEVPDTAFYKRLLADGSLRRAQSAERKVQKSAPVNRESRAQSAKSKEPKNKTK